MYLRQNSQRKSFIITYRVSPHYSRTPHVLEAEFTEEEFWQSRILLGVGRRIPSLQLKATKLDFLYPVFMEVCEHLLLGHFMLETETDTHIILTSFPGGTVSDDTH